MNINGKPYRTIWPIAGGSIEAIDQTKLPHRFETKILRNVEDAADAIRRMIVRGAPLIGATAAYGLALALRDDPSDEGLDKAYGYLLSTRPTAVNLRWALDRVRNSVRNRRRELRAEQAWREAAAICDEDVATCRRIGEVGVELFRQVSAAKPGETVNV